MNNKTTHSFAALAAAGAFMLIGGGCANPSHAVLYQQTTLGVNAGTNPETGNFKLRVGFKREFAAVIPKVVLPADPNNPEAGEKIEAGSTFSASRYSVKGLQIPEVEEFIVTGDAATTLGATPGAMGAFSLNKK